MKYNDIDIQDNGFVQFNSVDEENRINGSIFCKISPLWVITLAKTVYEEKNTKPFMAINVPGRTEEIRIEFDDVANMELTYQDLQDALIDSVDERRGRRVMRQCLRSVEMILLNPQCMPTQGTEGSAGYDCFADVEALKGNSNVRILDNVLTLEPGQCELIPLGFKLLIGNPNYEARLVPRSGKGHKGLVLGNMTGTIDSDYEGVWMMSMWNRTEKPLEVKLNEAVCQMVFDRVEHPSIILVDDFSSFGKTDRGDGGFGSTDVQRILAKD